MVAAKQPTGLGGEQRDAAQDYPESDSETSRVRVWADLTGIEAVGIDEIRWQHGHRYLTLVYRIDPGHRRLLWTGQTRRVKTLLRCFRWFGRERTRAPRFVCSDMWQPYLTVVAKKAGHALHVLDRFHIALNMNTAIATADKSRWGWRRGS